MVDVAARPPVVVADDDSDVRRVLARIIRNAGHEAVVTEDGQGALVLCRQHRPRLLLVDRNMPPPRYSAIARTLRNELGADAPHIVVVTGNCEVSHPDDVDGVLSKPFEMDEIRLLLARFAE